MTQINIYDSDKFFDGDYLADLKEALKAAYGLNFTDPEIFERAMDERYSLLEECIEDIANALDNKNDDNPHWNNSILVRGSIERWDGDSSGYAIYSNTPDAFDCSASRYGAGNVFADCEIDRIWLEGDGLCVTGHHHDGCVSVTMRQLTDLGQSVINGLCDGYIYDSLDVENADGEVVAHFDEDEESKLMSWLWTHDAYSSVPRLSFINETNGGISNE